MTTVFILISLASVFQHELAPILDLFHQKCQQFNVQFVNIIAKCQ